MAIILSMKQCEIVIKICKINLCIQRDYLLSRGAHWFDGTINFIEINANTYGVKKSTNHLQIVIKH